MKASMTTLPAALVIIGSLATCSTANILKTDPFLLPDEKCTLRLESNKTILKNVGESWISTLDPCLTYTCISTETGPAIKEILKSCAVQCEAEFELIKSDSQCCGKCVQTKCNANGRIHNVGEIWKSADNCTFNECSSEDGGTPTISSYRKNCPKLPVCPPANVYIEDCCEYCNQTPSRYRDSRPSNGENGLETLAYESYKSHPCHRDCLTGAETMACNYTFVLEWYETLSKACYDCPYNTTDCKRPHCIVGDGTRRGIVVINRMMPGPPIEVCLGDTIIVDVVNRLLGDSTTMHWHGLHQRNNPYMDGVPQISQCPIPPHTTFRYTFEADNPGTHFYHSHTGMQRGDGAFGAMIIRQPKSDDRHGNLFDFDLSEHVMNLQDWAHQPGVSMFVAHHHSIGDNKPPSILINGLGRYFERQLKQAAASVTPPVTEVDDLYEDLTLSSSSVELQTENETEAPPTSQSPTVVMMKTTRKKRSDATELNSLAPIEIFTVNQGYRYRFRLVNAEFLNCPMELSIDGHNLTVIASDGFDMRPQVVTSIVSYAGERFDFVVTTNKRVDNYWIRIRGLMDCDERFTSAYQVAVLRYNGAAEVEPNEMPRYDFQLGGLQMNALNRGTEDATTLSMAELTAADPDDLDLLSTPDYKFYVNYDFYEKDNPNFHVAGLYGFNQVTTRSNRVLTPQLNHISMKMPSSPLMVARDRIDDSAFCNATSLEDAGVDCTQEFCECSHVLQVRLNSVVEMLLIDEGMAYDANHPFHLHGNAFRVVAMERLARNVTLAQVKALDEAGGIGRKLRGALIKDTVTVPDGGYTIIRFKADNPGYWLFHCHIEFHAEVGMSLVLKVGEHHEMKPVPRNFPTCSDYMPSSHESFVEFSKSDARTTWSTPGFGLLFLTWLTINKLFL